MSKGMSTGTAWNFPEPLSSTEEATSREEDIMCHLEALALILYALVRNPCQVTSVCAPPLSFTSPNPTLLLSLSCPIPRRVPNINCIPGSLSLIQWGTLGRIQRKEAERRSIYFHFFCPVAVPGSMHLSTNYNSGEAVLYFWTRNHSLPLPFQGSCCCSGVLHQPSFLSHPLAHFCKYHLD